MAGVGELLMDNPVTMDPAPAVDAGAMPQVEQNKGLWKNFMQRMQDDPNFKQAVMATGLGMMKTPQFGQNGFDVASNALMGGMDRYQSLNMQNRQMGREDKKDALDEKQVTGSLDVAKQNAGTYGTSVQQQGVAQQAAAKSQDLQDIIAQTELAINADLKKRGVAADEKRADAAMISAEADKSRADSGYGGSMSTQVQLVKMRAQALMAMNPKLDQNAANLQAQNELILGKGKSPGQFALDLFKSALETRQNDLSRIGQPITQQELDGMRQQSTDFATQFFNLGRDRGGTVPAGTIDRSGGATPTAPTPGGGQEFVGKTIKDGMGKTAKIVAVDESGVATLQTDRGTARVPLEQITQFIMAE